MYENFQMSNAADIPVIHIAKHIFFSDILETNIMVSFIQDPENRFFF